MPSPGSTLPQAPSGAETRMAGLKSYVGQMLGNLVYTDAALAEKSVVGNPVKQIGQSLRIRATASRFN